MNTSLVRTRAACLASASAAALLLLPGVAPAQGAAGSGLEQISHQFREVAHSVEPSVVHIEVQGRLPGGPGASAQSIPEEDFLRRFFERHGFQLPEDRSGDRYEQYDVPSISGVGSGWIYDADGHVVTNNHVVGKADKILVRFHDGTERTASVVATDPQTDIAVLEVEKGHGQPARLATEEVDQGDIVFAFGSPMQLDFSMSQGIVSGVGRQTGILGASGYEDFIQTDAAINPGNSGGPLTNIRGEVVGMNTAILSRSGLFSGMGFAIPTRMMRPVIEELLTHGSVRRGFLGVTIQDGADLLQSFHYSGKGVLIADVVAGEAGDRAGLERGDIITELDGKPMETSHELRQAIAAHHPSDRVQLHIVRNGHEKDIEVTLGSAPDSLAATGNAPSREEPHAQQEGGEALLKLGIEDVRTLTPRLADELGTNESAGVVIGSVRAMSVAAAAGLESGMLITEVFDTSVSDVADLTRALEGQDLSRGVRLTVRADGISHYVFLKLAS
jgi:serine protease Do